MSNIDPRHVSATPPRIFQESSEYIDYVKSAHNSAVQTNEESVPNEMITALLFEEVGGSELALLSRHDTIGGIDVDYSLIGNLSSVNSMFNSNNIITGFEQRDTYVNHHQTDISPDLETVYFNDQGDLVIEVNDVSDDEEIEAVLLVDGMIYTV